MAIQKQFTTPQGIIATYHRLVKVELSANTGWVELLFAVFANAEVAQLGAAPLWHESVRVQIKDFASNPIAAFYPVAMAQPDSYLRNGVGDEQAPANAFGLKPAASPVS